MRALRKLYPRNSSLWEKIYTSDWFDSIYEIYTKVRVFFQTVERFFFWGWKLRNSYDFDSAFVYEMLYLKYERIEKCLENGHCVHNKTEMRRLKTIKCLALRLFEANYAQEEFALLEKQGKSFTTKTDGVYRITPEGHRANKNVEDRENRDKEMMFALISKYNGHFWD